MPGYRTGFQVYYLSSGHNIPRQFNIKIMALEIERKFLVKGDFRPEIVGSSRISQGYISTVPGRTVRIRTSATSAFLTIKGALNDSGVSRYEWEMEIPAVDASDLLRLCEPGIIEKTRYEVKRGNHMFEVDEFHGDNEGLIIAEIELASEEEPFEKPDWLGEEVTGDRRYYNSMLMKNPYKNW